MTDARYPERWLNDRRLTRLSHPGHRLFMAALVWSVSNRTDGCIERDDLQLLPAPALEGDPEELLRAGLWDDNGDCWRIREFEDTQTTRRELEVLDDRRRRDREKKRRQRAAAQEAQDASVPRDNARDKPVPRDKQGDVSRDVHRTGEARTGQARPGQERAPRGTTADVHARADADRVRHSLPIISDSVQVPCVEVVGGGRRCNVMTTKRSDGRPYCGEHLAAREGSP